MESGLPGDFLETLGRVSCTQSMLGTARKGNQNRSLPCLSPSSRLSKQQLCARDAVEKMPEEAEAALIPLHASARGEGKENTGPSLIPEMETMGPQELPRLRRARHAREPGSFTDTSGISY